MARQNALSLLQQNGVTPELLAELYGDVIEGVEATAVSVLFKSYETSSDFSAGTAEYKRFVNSASNPYGTARTAGAGAKLKIKPVVVAIDIEREIIEEVEEKDLTEYGVRNILGRRKVNHVASMARELDIAFFREGYVAGTQFTPSVGATTWLKKIEELAVHIENVKNDFVHGVPRQLIKVAVTPEVYSDVLQSLQLLPARENSWANGDFGMLNSLMVAKSVNLPSGVAQVVDVMAMVQGSIAQPVHAVPFDIERVQLSKAYAIELFYDYGTKAIMEDLIFYIGDAYVA